MFWLESCVCSRSQGSPGPHHRCSAGECGDWHCSHRQVRLLRSSEHDRSVARRRPLRRIARTRKRTQRPAHDQRRRRGRSRDEARPAGREHGDGGRGGPYARKRRSRRRIGRQHQRDRSDQTRLSDHEWRRCVDGKRRHGCRDLRRRRRPGAQRREGLERQRVRSQRRRRLQRKVHARADERQDRHRNWNVTRLRHQHQQRLIGHRRKSGRKAEHRLNGGRVRKLAGESRRCADRNARLEQRGRRPAERSRNGKRRLNLLSARNLRLLEGDLARGGGG